MHYYSVSFHVVLCDLGKVTLDLTFLICKMGMILFNSKKHMRLNAVNYANS